ncbi:patatin-like phospholipase family protein [Shewanella avicenniae]|uniref:Patatin-like phospholipase family protein n=1 Tax=Shewanella avicenniae TaxID=2814294 RepID=A0ABX7QRC8_9GAMM|nr:patatin-like phospholipase family protein [Shewanella avicenniae]QSX34019.1 patatin-like phospholipase family protein [Shewanella avicenniae]
MSRFSAVLLNTFLLCALGLLCQPLFAAERPKIGLVLSGGGAKGAAHVGVIKVLEQHHIPVDYVAGTSIGAYVGGLYALGYSAAEIEQLMMGQNWDSGYSDTIPREVLAYREKQQRDRFNIPINMGLRDGEVQTPQGILLGQTMSRLYRTTAGMIPTFDSFNQLSIPYRAVATDLETSRAVVLAKGSLIEAMQASATVPGALQPALIDGKLLVDGGIANNMPVDVAKAMGADIVIAVDIGSSLVNKQQLNGALAILNQLSTMLTNVSTERQKALLTEDDILIRPAVDTLSTTDFSIMPIALKAGEAAANLQLAQLTALALPEEQFIAYQQHKRQISMGWRDASKQPLIAVKFSNDSTINTRLLTKVLDIHPGDVVDKQQLDNAIGRLYSLNKFERVTAEFEDTADGRVLNVDAKAKSWGPNYLQFGFNWEDDLSLDSSLTIDFALNMTDITANGGEWRNEVRMGFEKMISSEFYQPLDADQHIYSRAQYRYLVNNWEFFEGNSLYYQLEREAHGLELGVGFNFASVGIVEFGIHGETGRISNRALINNIDFTSYGSYLRLGYDTLNSISFPTSGNRFRINLFLRHEDYSGMPDPGQTFQIEADWKGVVSVNSHSFVGKAAYASIDNDSDFSAYVTDLGGFLNLSGYHKNSLAGAKKVFGAFIYQYDLGRDVLGMQDYPLYLGASIEAGNVWSNADKIEMNDLIYGGSIYLGTNTAFGPAALGIGLTDDGEQAMYLFIGKNF